MSILDALRDDNYTLGACTVLPYSRLRVDVFGTNYLHHLYKRNLESRPSDPYGTLPQTYCGLADLSYDAIANYHTSRADSCPIILLGINESPTLFTPLGYCFATEHIKSPSGNSAFAAFSFFRESWGTPELTVLGMLGLTYLFCQYNLLAIHGQRYDTNALAARFMHQFGSRDVGTIQYLLRNHKGGLESCVVSTLLRVDFESYVARTLLQLAKETGETTRNGEGI